MKKVAVLFALLCAVLQTRGQVTVEVQLDQEQYLPNEALVARVKIQNSSGQTLRLGQEANWLTFVIEPTGGQYVRPLKQPEVQGAFDLESSSIATKRVDLASCFDLTHIGNYKITATVRVASFGSTYASPAKAFFIGNGSKIKEIEFGVPPTIATAGANGKPEVRKYILIQTNPGADAKLFVRVTDPLENNFKVVPIGSLVSFSRPEPQLDRWSNLHLLYQTGARSLLYTEINPEGMVIARETHEIVEESRPTLISNDEGRISVRGGGRRYTSNDIPPVDPVLASAPVQEPIPTLPPAKTNASTKKNESSSGKDAKEKPKR